MSRPRDFSVRSNARSVASSGSGPPRPRRHESWIGSWPSEEHNPRRTGQSAGVSCHDQPAVAVEGGPASAACRAARQPGPHRPGPVEGSPAPASLEHGDGLHVVVVADRPDLRRRHLPPPELDGPAAGRGRVADLFVRGDAKTTRARSRRSSSPTSRSGSPTASCAATAASTARPAPQRVDTTRSTCCQLYGVTPRPGPSSCAPHEGGRLKSQQLSGEEFPPYLCEDGVNKPEFSRDRGRAAGSDPARAAGHAVRDRAATRRTRRSGSR